MTAARYAKDLKIVSGKAYKKSSVVSGEAPEAPPPQMGPRQVRKLIMTALASHHPLMKVSYYTRNSIKTIQKYYFKPKPEEISHGRENVAQLLETGGQPLMSYKQQNNYYNRSRGPGPNPASPPPTAPTHFSEQDFQILLFPT